jgi:hypothetical protein
LDLQHLNGVYIPFRASTLDKKDSAIDYYHTSRLAAEDAACIADIHFHPIEPVNFRIGLTAMV